MMNMKHYSAVNVNGHAMIAYDGIALLDGLYLHANLNRQYSRDCFLREIRQTEDELILDFTDDLIPTLTVTLKEYDHALQFTIHAQLREFNNGFGAYFTSDRGLVLHYHFVTNPDNVLSFAPYDRFWQTPFFEQDISKLLPVTQSILTVSNGQHCHLLPLTCETFRSEISGNTLEMTTGCAAIKEMAGTFLTINLNKDPYQAIALNFQKARQSGAIRVPLKTERTYPQLLEGLGWCSWSAFDVNVTSQGIYQKCQEFQDKGIPVEWIILDMGWQKSNKERLISFGADLEKFPEGLAAFITRVKRDYGIKKVGVWHPITGYWDAIDPNSEIAKQQKDNLITTPGGMTVIAPTFEQQFNFFDAWHGYLKEQGVDFVKVDNQSGASDYYNELLPSPVAVAAIHKALDASVNKHFDGCLINCMGVNMENVLNRPSSAVNRNSYDFAPEKTESFYIHLWDNVYSALIHDQIQYCDYDMWWSDHPSSPMSAVLRAISGGPIYIADPVDRSSIEYISPLIDENGHIYRCDHAAYPTKDCLYEDVIRENKVVKIFNRSDKNFAVAAFCQNPEDVNGTIHIEEIPEMSGSYAAQDYFSKKWVLFDAEHPIHFKVKFNEVRLWNFYPIEDKRVQVGRADKFMGCATAKTECFVSELIK